MWSSTESFQRYLNPFFKREAIKSLHLELTTQCKIACRRCDRTFAMENHPYSQRFPYAYQGPKVNPTNKFNPRVHMNIDMIKRLIPADSTFSVFLSGNYGDPLYHPQIEQIVDYLLYETNIEDLELVTNGSGMTEDFWRSLAIKIKNAPAKKKSRIRITFSIDGLEDTNHLYRRGSHWASIINGIILIRDACEINWKFIVFKHNQHQLQEAKRLSKQLGFKTILFVQSNRYTWWWAGGDPDIFLSRKDFTTHGDPLEPTIDIEKTVQSLPT